ncbi:MAG: RHS repeat-associated core domain-containing protein [Pseudomonadota bacterium]
MELLKSQRVYLFTLFIFLISSQVSANTLEGDIPNQAFPQKDYGYNFHESHSITPDLETLTSDLFGDKIDLASGSIRFEQVDVSIPGNSQLPVEIRRTLSDPDSWFRETRDFANWSLSLPHVRSTYITDRSGDYKNAYWAIGKACSAPLNDNPRFSTNVEGASYVTSGDAYWNGDSVSIPGKGSAKFTTREGDSTHKRYNKMNWEVSCLANGGREGFKIVDNEGVTYFFNHEKVVASLKPYVLQAYISPAPCTVCSPESLRPLPGTPSAIEYKQFYVFMLPTRIQDRFGNYVDYTYDSSGNLTKILANDGRQITLSYSNGRVSAITANGKTWIYRYDDNGISTLSSVSRPDAKQWLFQHNKTTHTRFWKRSNLGEHSQIPTFGSRCIESVNENFVTMTHPYGMQGSFVLKEECHEQSNVNKILRPNPQGYSGEEHWIPLANALYSIESKTLTQHDNTTYQWVYQYSDNTGLFLGDAIADTHRLSAQFHEIDSAHLKSTTTVYPDGSKIISYFDRRMGNSQGNLLYEETYAPNGVLLKRDSMIYEDGIYHGNPEMYNYVNVALNFFTKEQLKSGYGSSQQQRLVKKIVTLFDSSGSGNSHTYTTNFSNFDVYDKPLASNEANSTNAKTRAFKIEYYHDLTNHVLSLPSRLLITSGGTDVEVRKMTYHSATGSYKSLPYEHFEFGRWFKRNTNYHTTGVQAGLPKRVDYNANNRWVEFSNYKRGRAQTILTPQSLSTSTQSAAIVVNNDGWVTKVTDFEGDCTSYGYDAIGRLSLIDPCESRWSNTSITYATTTGNEGLSHIYPGMLKQVITQGNYQKVTYHDSLLRPHLIKEQDKTQAASVRYNRNEFDYANRTTFQSLPSQQSITRDGTTTTFDALGRTTRVQDNMSTGAINYRYFADNRVGVTDKKGHTTTTTYLAYGTPSQNLATLIQSPESISTRTQYNDFQNPVSITQGGITEERVYDAYQQLCKVLRPDTGRAAMAHDALGKMLWKATGNSINTSTLSCDNTVDANKKVTYTYDNLGNPRTITYGDGTATKVYTYSKDNELKQLTAGNVTTSYQFNSLGLVEKETLEIGSKSLVLDPMYNSLGKISALTYPSGRTVNLTVNALGQVTTVGPYVTHATYYPTGTLNTITYGNGVTYSTVLNAKKLPQDMYVRHSNGQTLSDLSYDYDLSDNVSGIQDNLQSRYNISMSYDGLNRLDTANGYWGSGYFQYDDLSNITKKVLGNQTFNYTYTQNRLSTVTGAKTYHFAYDERGNVTHNGHRQFTVNLANHMQASGGINYLYDGHDKRVRKTKNGQSDFSFYGLDGQLLYRQKANGDHVDYIYLNKHLITTVEKR